MTDLDVQIGDRIRALRNEQNISQTDLADALNLTFQQVQKYEQGTNHVSAGRLADIAAFFRVPILTFYQEDAKPSATGGRGRTKRSSGMQLECDALSRDYRRIKNPAARRQVRDLARLLAGSGGRD
jgi:transcriptional regulator with XRE-family HTH domain